MGLYEDLNQKKKELKHLKEIISGQQRKMNALVNSIREIERLMEIPTITDHALLRYIERVQGYDVDAIRAQLLTDTVVSAMRSGAKKVKSNGYNYVLSGCTVVTIT